MTPRPIVAAALLAACQELTPIARTPADAAADRAPTDAPSDASADTDDDDGAPDVPAAVDVARALLGLTAGVAVGADGDRDDVLRLVYVDANGALHTERRDAETLARLCEADLGAPPDARVEGAPALASPAGDPAVPLPGPDLIVRALDARGAAHFWERASSRTPGPCGATFGGWQAVPDGPVAWASSPEAFVHVGDPSWRRVLVAATGVDGAVYLADRPLVTPGAWSAWRRFAPNAVDERAASRPTLVQRGADAVSVAVVTEGAGGAQRLREQSCVVRSIACRAAWVDLAPLPARAATPLRWIVAAADPAVTGGRTDQYYGIRAIGDAAGRVWTQSFFVATSPFPEFGDWGDLGAPFGPVPLALTLGLRRGHALGAADAALLVNGADAPRALRHARCTARSCDAAARGWGLVPDPLR